MKALALILAGGKRKELMPLVDDRHKAAVPFFGKYRVIDFVLSNCLNSGIRQCNVVVQHKFASLQKHIRDGWSIFSSAVGEYIDVYPPQQRRGEHWYTGPADSVYQNLFSITNENPDCVLTLSGDHIYKMDYSDIINYHFEKKADLTIASIPVPISDSRLYGVMSVDNNNRVVDFQEKPENFSCDENLCLASMAVYVFSTQLLKDIFEKSEKDKKEYQDFGRDIIPHIIDDHKVYAYPFIDAKGNPKTWRVLRTLKEYYEVNMAILNGKTDINIVDPQWPFRTYQSQSSPTRTFAGDNDENLIEHSAVSGGGVIEGKVINSILGTNVTIEKGAIVKDSIIFENVKVKKDAKITKAIIDKGLTINENTVLNHENHSGWSEYTITDDIIVLGKKAKYKNI